jgi:ribosomal protein L35
MAGLHQVRRHRLAHNSQTRKRNLHSHFSLSQFASRDSPRS